MPEPTYVMGRTEHEYQRLTEQADIMRPTTERLFRTAGIGPGMKVLDVGCGAGDVALLLAELVGPLGRVISIDLDAKVLDRARTRALTLGVEQIEFVQGDIRTAEFDTDFDAAAGRYILMYMSDPAAALARIAQKVIPGGIIAFQEMDCSRGVLEAMNGDSLWSRAGAALYSTFAAAGVRLTMASDLFLEFQKAGLPQPRLLGDFIVDGGPNSPMYTWMANSLKSVAPLAARFDISFAHLSDLDLLADRLRSEALARNQVMYSPTYIGACSHRPA